MTWITSIEFKQDAEFLWHCWWLPNRFINLDYAKGVSALLGWREDYRIERFAYWNSQGIAEVSHEGGLAAHPDIFETFQSSGMAWQEDRADALQNVFLLLQQNIERNRLVPQYCPPGWIQSIIWHWQQMDAHEIASCRSEADALQKIIHQFNHFREVA
jgi:hypothetical protein